MVEAMVDAGTLAERWARLVRLITIVSMVKMKVTARGDRAAFHHGVSSVYPGWAGQTGAQPVLALAQDDQAQHHAASSSN